MRAQAKDARGQGTAAATITSTMEEVADGTKVNVDTDMRVTGPAAQFGRGVMQDVSAKLMTRFAECLAEQMQASPDVETTTRRGAARPRPPRREPRPRRPRPADAAEALDQGRGHRRARRLLRRLQRRGRAEDPERVVAARPCGHAATPRPDRRRPRPRRGEPRRGAQARRPARRARVVALLILIRIIKR